MGLVTKTYTFTVGATIIASEHNTNFDTLYNLVNGNIENVNIAGSAAITDNKLAQITSASKVHGSSLTGLASIPSSAGFLPGANGGVPIGSIFMWGTTTAPTGYVLCDGTAYSRTSVYDALFAVVGTTFGIGDGSSTFNVPNMKGRLPVGFNSSDTSFDSMGETGGTQSNLHTQDITVPFNGWTVTHSSGAAGELESRAVSSDDYHVSSDRTLTSTSAGSATGNLPPYITLNFIIKY